jgi:hypothetical protein
MNKLYSLIADRRQPHCISSKRVIAFIAFSLCCTGFIASLMGIKMDSNIYNSMMYIVVAGMGFTVTEKFSSVTPPDSPLPMPPVLPPQPNNSL